ncbi:MAG TPA: hypothetical protein VGK19_11315 [Capsulimonadaceae bacterium]|jgi:hypothetical protein
MPDTIHAALSHHRFETARRLCIDALAHTETPERNVILMQLHDAYRALGDFQAATLVLDDLDASSDAERFARSLCLAEDYHLLTNEGFYRESAERYEGYTLEEYVVKLTKLADESFRAAMELIVSDAQRSLVAASLKAHGRVTWVDQLGATAADAPTVAALPALLPTGALTGIVRFDDGTPAAGVKLVLGLDEGIDTAPPVDYMSFGMHFEPVASHVVTVSTVTEPDGWYRFDDVPAGRQEFMAVVLDPKAHDISTRFLAQGFDVAAGDDTTHDLTITEWQSAPSVPPAFTFPATVTLGDVVFDLIGAHRMRNPFCFTFPRQAVHLPIPDGIRNQEGQLLVFDSAHPTDPIPWQPAGFDNVLVFTHLDPLSERSLAVYAPKVAQPHSSDEARDLKPVPDPDGRTAVIDTGRAAFRIAWGVADKEVATVPPLVSVRGEDGVWRGQGRFVLPDGTGIASRETRVMRSGPLETVVTIRYTLSDGRDYHWKLTAHAGEAYLLVRESSPPVDGASFDFSLREFAGGRGFLHWTPEHGNRHWRTLAAEKRELARLQESVAWWIPPQGFGYAMTDGTLASKDYIGVFTIRRGEWVDREFERLSQGPINADGTENRELDWPFPEMVGSTISMITAHTDETGDVFFRFGLFNGDRQWGILASSLSRNDGTYKEISAVQHKTSSPRLEEFMRWHLDEPDTVVRPTVVARRENIQAIRAKRHIPSFASFWERICSGKAFGPATGVRFLVEGDPAVAWRKKRELVSVAHVRSRMTLLGRDYSDMYSPVGARPITQWAEDYDLVAASGVFTPDEERLVRSFLILMAHLYMETDFMNWKFNSRNANFESDRVDVVGAIGLAFRGHPDSQRFIDHCTELMERSLEVYCTPGSGKWYENPACYYLHASKCRTNLAYHLFAHGVYDSASIPRFKDYLRWGVLLLTPKTPGSYDEMRDGLTSEQYAFTLKVRRVPPVGDHALIGPWVPDYYALMSTLYRKRDPEFADTLLWAFHEGGRDGGYYGNAPLLFCALSEGELDPLAGLNPTPLTSRRLEGFGGIFRGSVGTADEFYMLLKQGPGGYRYHRTEGSFILFADGKPLIYDGGEAGETWRHSTLSFHATHMPLAPGHVERFATTPVLDFVQGVHPAALSPGDPVFLSDDCHHSLVQKAYDRFAEPNPADSRSVIWVRDEYVIVHDELNLPDAIQSHWHLQVVAGSETGDWRNGYLFAGRFGTDLQVLLPDQQFAAETRERVPILDYHRTPENSFAMRHLMLTGAPSVSRYVAVLRPLNNRRGPISASLLPGDGTVVRVTGEGIDDTIFLGRSGFSHGGDDFLFDGRYGAILRRPSHSDIVALDGTVTVGGEAAVSGDSATVKRAAG